VPTVAQIVRADEGHLPEVRALTAGGDNDVARWAWDGQQVVLQARGIDRGCARVSRVTLTDPPRRASVGDGQTPAFLPGNRDVVYAAAPTCGKRRARADGISLDPAFDVYRAKADGSDPVRLAEAPGFDGEPNVCGKDGSIVFSSARDGDVDLYRMDSSGAHVQRLTATAGYDGGAVFDSDCTHIAWHASRPKGKDLDDYKKQLAANLVRPTSLELWVANADGTDARQVTYLDARSSSPTFFPSERRILFASDVGSESARASDLWAIDFDGTNLERVTTAPGADEAPSFSPDGKWIAFASDRATMLGQGDVNVFVSRWTGAWRHVEERAADHLMGDAAWLADRAREGRALGTKGLDEAGAYVERSFASFGLSPAGQDGFRQAFDVTTRVAATTTLDVAGVPVDEAQLRASGLSASATVQGPLVYVAADDDYARIDPKGKIVVMKPAGSLRHAARLAHERGAVGLLAVAESGLPATVPESGEGIVTAFVAREAIAPVLAGVVRGQHPVARLAVTLSPEKTAAFNVLARWPASVPQGQRLPGVVVVGAHYDSFGEGSPGGDDNASGTAALLHVGRSLGEKKPALRRDVVLAAFSGEEQGAAGAAAFVQHPPPGLTAKDILVMIDLDMVGRLRDDVLQVFGADTAAEWPELLRGACDAAHVDCVRATGAGFGGADRVPFFDAGIPSLHLFTGVHGDHHTATDTAAALNATGMAQVARIAEHIARDVSDLGGRLAFAPGAIPPGEGDTRAYGVCSARSPIAVDRPMEGKACSSRACAPADRPKRRGCGAATSSCASPATSWAGWRT
jgi:hypothetical protein